MKSRESVFEYEEVPVTVTMSRSWSFESWILMTSDENYFIDIEELFHNLEILYEMDNESNSASGFIERENRQYLIDLNALTIGLDGKIHELANKTLFKMGNLYISALALQEIFGIKTSFNLRDLSLNLSANFELPRFKEMRLEEMRQNIAKLQGREFNPDTIIARERHLYKAGMLDWKVSSNQSTAGYFSNSLQLEWGSEFLYGKMNVRTFISDKFNFVPQNLFYDWHWVDNESKFIRQIRLGKFEPNEIEVHRDVIGASITNRSTNIRKASGTYEVSDRTNPNWTVELYINNRLVDYTVADAAGMFTFTVPVIYGSTTIKIKTYGPSGEERMEQQDIKTPYSLMMRNTFEYTVSGGIIPTYKKKTDNPYTEDYAYLLRENLTDAPRYGILNMMYGVTHNFTLRGGVEYASSPDDFRYLQSSDTVRYAPFGGFAFQPFSRLHLTGHYNHNSRTGGAMSINFPAKINVSAVYYRHLYSQYVIDRTSVDQTRFSLSKSYSGNRISGSFQCAYSYLSLYNYSDLQTIDASLSNSLKRFHSSIAFSSHITDSAMTKSGMLSLSYSFGPALTLHTSTEHNLDTIGINRATTSLNADIGKGRLSANYTRNFLSHTNTASLNYSLDFDILRTRFGTSYANKNVSFQESVEGSFAFAGDDHVKANNRRAVDKAGITIYPYFDMNYNNRLDSNDRQINAPILRRSYYRTTTDSLSRIGLINVNTTHKVVLSNDDLEYIGWRLPYERLEIEVDPNQYKRVNIPIQIFGEASGSVRSVPSSMKVSLSRDMTLDYLYDDPEDYSPDPAIMELLNYDSSSYVRYPEAFERYRYIVERSPNAVIRINTPQALFEEKDGVLAYFIKHKIYGLHVETANKWARNVRDYFIDVLEIPERNIIINNLRDSNLYDHPYFKEFRGKIISLAVTNATSIPTGTDISHLDTYETIYEKEQLTGVGDGIRVEFFDEKGELAAEVMTESGGYFSYLGLRPGEYTLRINKEQLRELGLRQYPDDHSIKVNVSHEGDYIPGNDFILVKDEIIHHRRVIREKHGN